MPHWRHEEQVFLLSVNLIKVGQKNAAFPRGEIGALVLVISAGNNRKHARTVHLNSNIHKSSDKISKTQNRNRLLSFFKTNEFVSFCLTSYCTSSINITKAFFG